MNQEVMPDPLPVVFTFPAWNSDTESWDDYLRAVEEAYAQFRACSGSNVGERQSAQYPHLEEQGDVLAH